MSLCKTAKPVVALLCLAVLLVASGTPKTPAVYQLELSGQVEASGVIDYAGLSMNVYQDAASNPCGDCADQPVSVYVGATAEQVSQAMAEAIERADDIWQVTKVDGAVLLLQEKTPGQAEQPHAPSAPTGLEISGQFTPAGG